MTKPEVMQDYEAIYLAPKCMASGEREWCEHDAPYDCDCDDGPHPWIKFVRSDIAEAAEQRGMERAADICAYWAEKYAAASDSAKVAKKRIEARDFESMGMACRLREHDIRQGEQA